MKYLLLIALILPLTLEAKIKAVTTVPDLSWALQQVGGEEIEIASLLSGHEDPHFVDAMPSFIFKSARADLLCFIGLELEVGWLPKVSEKSANQKIMFGQPGHCDTSKAIQPLEVHQHATDRSLGDVHSTGNPHYTLSPMRMKEVISYYQEILSQLEPQKIDYFKARAELAQTKLDRLIKEIQSDLKDLHQIPVMEYHKEFTYFIHDFKLNSKGAVEQISGVPPAAAEMIAVAKKIREQKVKLILASPSANLNVLNKLANQTQVQFLRVPVLVRIDENDGDYIKHMQEFMNRLKEALKSDS